MHVVGQRLSLSMVESGILTETQSLLTGGTILHREAADPDAAVPHRVPGRHRRGAGGRLRRLWQQASGVLARFSD